MSSRITEFIAFTKTSINEYAMLLNKCERPNYKEFISTAQSVAIGAAVIGFTGFAVKVGMIPLNNILVGA